MDWHGFLIKIGLVFVTEIVNKHAMIWAGRAGICLDLPQPTPLSHRLIPSLHLLPAESGEHIRTSESQPTLVSAQTCATTKYKQFDLTYFNFRKIQMENSFLGVLQRFPVIRIRPSSELTLTRVSKVSNIYFQSLPPPLVLHKNYCVYCNLFTASKRYKCC